MEAPDELLEDGPGQLERLILYADASTRYYIALDAANNRGRNLLAGLVALALVVLASALVSMPVVAATDLPSNLILVVLSLAIATLLAWRRALPASRYHHLSVEWRLQGFFLKKHQRTAARISSVEFLEGQKRLEHDGRSLRGRSKAKHKPKLWTRCETLAKTHAL